MGWSKRALSLLEYEVKLDRNKYKVKEPVCLKDLGIVVSTAMAIGIPLPVSTTANHVLKMAQSRGPGHLHPAALINPYEEFSQFEGYG